LGEAPSSTGFGCIGPGLRAYRHKATPHLGKYLRLLAPYKSKKKEKKPWPRWLVQKRRRIETVISQMAERYQAKNVWARDHWHLTSCFLRKVLSHTMAVFLCQEADLSPLRFAELLTD
jgi:hypothetical protein